MSEEMDVPARAPRMRLTPEQRDRFLEILGQTGNRRFAAEAIGVEPRLMDQRREFDKVLDRQWREALAQADRRLAGASGPLDCVGGALNVIKRGAGGRLQLVACGPKRWTRPVDERFFAALGACGNISAAARSVGFSLSCIAQRRKQFPDFAQKMEEALEAAELVMEFRVATAGGGFYGLGDGDGEQASAGSAEGDSAMPQAGNPGEQVFDSDMAMRFLKWREGKRSGRQHSRRDAWRKPPPIEEVSESILRKVAAIRRSREARQLEEGWKKDEEGRMIPPGWVRAEAAGGGLGGGKDDGATGSAA